MKDIRRELATRKYKTTSPFIYWAYHKLAKLVYRKCNMHFEIIDDVNDCDGPCVVIFNHLSRLDHIYVMLATYPKRINMLAGYNEFFRSHLHTVFKLNNVLPKKNYCNDITGMKAMMSIIKQGGSITFAPEGLASNDGTNKPIVPGTGHLLKKLNVPVYFCELRGQYLQNTKHCLDERHGKTCAKLSLLFSTEELKELSSVEIDDKINNSFRHDEYAWQKEQHVKWESYGRICHRLEDVLYRCPRCGKEFEMYGHENVIECKACGNGATVDDYYDFHKFNDDCVIPDLFTDWITEERMAIIREIRNDPDFSFKENVKIGILPNDRYLKKLKTSVIVSEGVFTVDHDGVHYRGKNDDSHDFDLTYNEIYTVITEVDSSFFNFYVKGEYHDVFPERKSSIKISMLIEEMHRLHVNTYKNFVWNDFMYEPEKNK